MPGIRLRWSPSPVRVRFRKSPTRSHAAGDSESPGRRGCHDDASGLRAESTSSWQPPRPSHGHWQPDCLAQCQWLRFWGMGRRRPPAGPGGGRSQAVPVGVTVPVLIYAQFSVTVTPLQPSMVAAGPRMPVLTASAAGRCSGPARRDESPGRPVNSRKKFVNPKHEQFT